MADAAHCGQERVEIRVGKELLRDQFARAVGELVGEAKFAGEKAKADRRVGENADVQFLAGVHETVAECERIDERELYLVG